MNGTKHTLMVSDKLHICVLFNPSELSSLLFPYERWQIIRFEHSVLQNSCNFRRFYGMHHACHLCKGSQQSELLFLLLSFSIDELTITFQLPFSTITNLELTIVRHRAVQSLRRYCKHGSCTCVEQHTVNSQVKERHKQKRDRQCCH